jgi:ubiquinone/menaquinone biosynthesis C-methylase UbiE
MNEMKRVLKRGGIVGANEGTIDDSAPLNYLELLEKHPAIHRNFSSDSLRRLFEDSGFQILELREMKNTGTPTVARKIGFWNILAFMFTIYPGMLMKLLRNPKLREASRIDDRVTKLGKKYAGYTLIVGKKG